MIFKKKFFCSNLRCYHFVIENEVFVYLYLTHFWWQSSGLTFVLTLVLGEKLRQRVLFKSLVIFYNKIEWEKFHTAKLEMSKRGKISMTRNRKPIVKIISWYLNILWTVFLRRNIHWLSMTFIFGCWHSNILQHTFWSGFGATSSVEQTGDVWVDFIWCK